LSNLACRYAPATLAVATSWCCIASIMMDIIKASVGTVGDDVSSLVYKTLCGLPSATVRPLILPNLFSFITLIALSAPCFCSLVSSLTCCLLKTPNSCSCRNS
jgi:hypothetical protein